MSTESGSEAAQKILNIAKAQSYEYRKDLIRLGELVSADSFCELLGIDRARLSQLVANEAVMEFDFDGQYFYPKFYANFSDTVREDIERISIHLGSLSASQKWMFFTRPKGSLGAITPVEALANGQYEAVLIAARGFRDR